MAASKTTTPKAFCFVLMPFSEEFDDVYRIGIKEACDKAGAHCERVDEQIFNETILERVYNQIAKADLVIADMTGRNPNVFYEVGYAHALGKLTILLTQNVDDIPFDLKNFPHIVYEKKISFLRDELKRRIKYFVKNPSNKSSNNKSGLELLFKPSENYTYQNLATGKSLFFVSKTFQFNPFILIHNSSSKTYAPHEFKLGIITSSRFKTSGHWSDGTTKLSNGTYLHMLPPFSVLFPNSNDLYRCYFELNPESSKFMDEKEVILIRLFMEQGSEDFSVILSPDND